MPPKTKSNKRTRAPRKMKMYRKMRRSGDVPEWASLTENITLIQNSQAATDTAVSYNLLSLGQSSQPFVRAQQVAEQYQFFRIKQVTYTFKPTFDTFQVGGPNTVPHLYWMINRTGEFVSYDLAGLTSRGAKPLRLDDRVVKIRYRPSVGVGAVQTPLSPVGLNPADQYRISPWLSTNSNTSTVVWNPSQVLHYGHYCMIIQAAPTQYDVVVTVEFEFKGPRFVDVSPALSRPPPKEMFAAPTE